MAAGMTGIIIIDKPSGWTSHDVVGKLRGLLNERRIGHGGTLDPMATGVLPVFIGRATRAVEFCENTQKEYIAGIELGTVTDTQDTTGNVLSRCECSISLEELQETALKFTGKQLQLPPMYSAVKINGKRLYELARRGIEAERKPREITIYKLEAFQDESGGFFLDIVCSKGTYIRTLCNDIGMQLGCGGAMCSLRRIRAGQFAIEDAVTIEDVVMAAGKGRAEELLFSVDRLFAGYPEIRVSPEDERRCRSGNDFSVKVCNGFYRVYNEKKEFLMLGRAEDGKMKTIKSFFEV